MRQAIEAGEGVTVEDGRQAAGRGWWLPAGLVAACVVGAVLRLYRLDQLPPGLHYDEALNGLTALRILEKGDVQPFYAANSGREGMWFYLLALAVRLGGNTVLALRLPSALAGILTIPLTYAAGLCFFGSRQKEARRTALIAAAAMAVSYWHLNFSRISFRAMLLPPFMLLTMAAFIVAWRSRKPARFAVAGALLGLTLYTYLAARAAPFIIVAFALAWAACRLWLRPGPALPLRRTVRAGPGVRPALVGLAVLVLAALLASAPLLYYFARHPGTFTGRMLSAAPAGGEASGAASSPFVLTLPTALDGMVKTARMFYDRGDANPQHGIPYRPVLDWPAAALLSAGLVVALRRVRRPEYALLLLWAFVMLLPVALSGETPNSLRGLGAQPAVCLLVGVGGAWVAEQIGRLVGRPGSRLLVSGDFWAPLVFLSVLVIGAASSAHGYFVAWPKLPQVPQAFDTRWVQAAGVIRQAVDQSDLYVPMELFTNPTVRYLLHDRYPDLTTPTEEIDPATLRDPHMVYLTGRGPLGPLVLLRGGDHPTASLLQPASDADWKALARSLRANHPLDGPGAGPILHDGSVDRAVIIPLTSGELAQLPRTNAPQYPLDACFTNNACLAGYTIEPVAAPARMLYVTLFWRTTRLLDDSFVSFVHLVDRSGAVIAQDNDVPTRNDDAGFLWTPGDLVPDVRMLGAPDGASGKARFEVGVVPLTGEERVPVVDGEGAGPGDAVQFGAVALTAGQAPGQAAAQAAEGSRSAAPQASAVPAPGPAGAQFGDAILLEGYDAVRTGEPANHIDVTLHWRGLRPIDRDYSVFVHLIDVASGAIIGQADHQPEAGSNPTSWWTVGEQVADEVSLDIPPDRAAGTLKLRVGWYSLAGGRRLPVFPAEGHSTGDVYGADFIDLALP